MSYATISVFGQPERLYRETLMKYVVSSQEKPQNFPIYSVHSDMDSFILYNVEIDPTHEIKVLAAKTEEQMKSLVPESKKLLKIMKNQIN